MSFKRGSSSLSGQAAVGLSLIGNLAPPVAAFVSYPIITQTIGAEGRGAVSAATAPLLLMLGIATLGLPDAATHFIARFPRMRTSLTLRSGGLVILAGAVSSAGVVSLSPFLSGGNQDLASLISLSSLAIAPTLLVAVLRGVAAGAGQWWRITADRLIQAGSRLIALLLLAHINQLTASTAVLCIVVSGLICGLPYLLRSGAPGIARPTHSARASTPAFRQVSHFALGAWAGSLTGILVSRLDQTLLGPLSSFYELGLYAVAVSISELPLVLNSAIRDVIFSVESSASDINRLTYAARVSTWVTAFVAAVVGIASVALISLVFGREFANALVPTLILLIAVVLGNAGSVVGAGLSARGRPYLRSISLLLALIVNVILLIILAPSMGAVGAALATLVGNTAAAFANLFWLHRLYRSPVADAIAFRLADFRQLVSAILLRHGAKY